MPVPDWIEKIGRKVFESPFGADGTTETPELAEIRLILLDAVRAKCQRVAGRQVFVYNTVNITVRGVHQADQEAWRSPFLNGMLQRELEASLKKAGVRFPDDLTLE